jgi:hypothetical protein
MEDRRQKIDKWLDAGLKHYAATEPREGLETRLRNSLRLAQTRLSFRRKWSIVFTLAGIAIIASALVVGKRKTTSFAPIEIASELLPVKRENPRPFISKPLLKPLRNRKYGGTRKFQIDARSDQFPAAHPMTSQEEMLIIYSKLHPEPTAPIAPVQIVDSRDLKIQDLNVESLGHEPSFAQTNESR